MGLALSNFFVEAERHAGVHGKLILSGITHMTSGQAATVPDSPELLARFQTALSTLRTSVKPLHKAALPAKASAEALRGHLTAVLDLMTQRALVLGDAPQTCQRIDEVAAHTLEVARVGVWQFSSTSDSMVCLDLYDRASATHSSGEVLSGAVIEPYLQALLTQRTLAANDAMADARTSSLKAYLEANSISSMLDVPVWANGRLVAVVCHEHVGPLRTWSADEERFAYLMGSFVSLALEKRDAVIPRG
jgi:hypothetical protein